MIKINQWLINRGILLLIVIAGITACAPNLAVNTEEPAETASVTPDDEDVATVEAPTATVEVPEVLLIAGADADPTILAQTQETIENLTSENGQTFLVAEDFTQDMISPGMKVVVGVGSDLDLMGMAAGAPQTAFVAVGKTNVQPASNLSVIGDPILDQQRQAFMAGYLTALISADYKVAALIPTDSDQSNLILNSYVIGARFFCGICKPLYPPYNEFPQWETLSTANAAGGFEQPVDILINKGVEVLYVHGSLASPELLSYLSDRGVKVVGDQSPGMARNNWVGTLIMDPGPGLIEIWPDLLAGLGGVQEPFSITLIDTEAGLISEGRMRLFNEMVADIEAGLISTAPNP